MDDFQETVLKGLEDAAKRAEDLGDQMKTLVKQMANLDETLNEALRSIERLCVQVGLSDAIARRLTDRGQNS